MLTVQAASRYSGKYTILLSVKQFGNIVQFLTQRRKVLKVKLTTSSAPRPNKTYNFLINYERYTSKRRLRRQMVPRIILFLRPDTEKFMQN